MTNVHDLMEMALKQRASNEGVLLVSLVTASSAGRIMGAGSTLYVSPNGSDTNDCASPLTACQTIGHALGLAPAGSTISIAAGTYGERVSLQRDVTLSGAGAGQTIIDGGQQGTVVSVTVSTTVAVFSSPFSAWSAAAAPERSAPTATACRGRFASPARSIRIVR